MGLDREEAAGGLRKRGRNTGALAERGVVWLAESRVVAPEEVVIEALWVGVVMGVMVVS